MNRAFEDGGFPAQAVGAGSLFSIHMTNKKPVKDISGFTHYDHAQYKRMFSFLLENGIVMLLPEMLHGGISYAHTDKDIRHLTNTVREYVKSNAS
jgi:glutamate-1-semialdehyde aminotransferase